MSLNYYYDLMSQPSRAVYMFLNMNKVPYVERPVAMRKGRSNNSKLRPTHFIFLFCIAVEIIAIF